MLSPRDELLARWEANHDLEAWEEACRLYAEAIEKDPDNPQLYHGYGYLMEGRGQAYLQRAAEYYEKGIEVGHWTGNHFHLLRTLAAMGQVQRAIDRYKKRLEAAPDEALSYSYLARAYLQAEQIHEAQKVVEAGLLVEPGDDNLLSDAGDVAQRLGEIEKALDYWAKAIDANPDHIGVRYSAAFLLERAGRLPEAADQWRAIVGYLTERDLETALEWPKRELQRVEALMDADNDG